jgi:predicted transposase/invertase (TIGR01784 family)
MKGDSIPGGHKNIKSRAIYNLCDLHASQEGRGVSYKNLMQSFQITFCGYTVFPERDGFIHRFSFRDASGGELLDSVGIVFVELTKLDDVMKKPVGEMTGVELWALFFSIGGEPKHRALLEKMIEIKEEIKVAAELLTNISRDPNERARFMSRRRFQMDREHDRAVAIEEGVVKVARNLLKMKMPLSDIAEATGLTSEEIEKLCN